MRWPPGNKYTGNILRVSASFGRGGALRIVQLRCRRLNSGLSPAVVVSQLIQQTPPQRRACMNNNKPAGSSEQHRSAPHNPLYIVTGTGTCAAVVRNVCGDIIGSISRPAGRMR